MRVAYPNELYHHGIMGQKWGIRRFQNPDGTLTALGRKRYGTVQNLMAGRTKKQADKLEAEKDKAIRSGKTKEVMKYSSEMTKKELDTAIQRIRDEQTLNALKMQDVSDAKAKLDKIIETGKTVKTAMEVSKDIYNLTAQTINTISGEKKMPTIGDAKASADELSKMFKYTQDKKAAERSDWFDKELQNRNLDYFKEHSNQYTTEELRNINERTRALENLNKSGSKSEKTSSGSTNKTENTSNKSNSSGNAKSTSETPVSEIKWPSGNTNISSSWGNTNVSSISSVDVTGTAATQAWLKEFWSQQ